MDTLTADRGVAALPPEAPLPMPVQSLQQAPPRVPRPPSSPRLIGLRRLLVVGGAVALTGAGVWQMKLVLAANGLSPLALVMLVLFVPLFAWVALSFTSAIAGFFSLLASKGRRLGVGRGRPSLPATRTALLMPCYNESPARVMGALQAMWEALRDAGADERFDMFVLSDTTEPDVWIAEEAAFLDLRRRTGADRIFYRHRRHNTARKSGNIADWVARWGGGYPQFLILDADSVMQADALLHLVGAIERHPDVGLIQTLPIITGGTTLFARIQQFAGRVYGPLIAHGIAWWHGAEGNYWGHNALIRTRAFAEQAGLPELHGRKPFGGHILSHDFVEAALMRRGGWAIHMVPGLPGSYEESPPSVVDLAVRDRRWCQGNLQHLAVLPARGVHWISRLHMLTGVGSYVTAPLWLLFLLAGILIALQARFVPPDYFPQQGKSLFPLWPVVDPVRAMWMFVGTMGLLLVPKLLGFTAVLFHGAERRGCGGAVRLLCGLLLESVIAGLLAPVVMLTQTVDIVAIAIGRDSGWNPQRRDDGSVPLRETVRKYRRHTFMGLAMAVAAWLVSPSLAAWMSPVIVGLALAIPLVTMTSWRSGLLARLGILRIPEEVRSPAVLQRARTLAAEIALETATRRALPDRLLQDDALLAAHYAMLPPPRRRWIDPPDVPLLTGRTKLDEAPSLQAAWEAMTRAERAASLADRAALDVIATRSV
ncbi:MAG TPA: glucans biosynthesis glucosyltransferase MdoH [Acetobacteraceae bacterium]|jgi:membrane glycosyltransferase|nr:glucans biosynthesis glucosyltransferase MdoH [Acetobacteraceae bacterium]